MGITMRSKLNLIWAVGAMSILCFGCSHRADQTSQPTVTSAVRAMSPSTKLLLTEKLRQSGGDYDKLSEADRNQLDAVSQGHGRMIFNQAARANVQR